MALGNAPAWRIQPRRSADRSWISVSEKLFIISRRKRFARGRRSIDGSPRDLTPPPHSGTGSGFIGDIEPSPKALASVPALAKRYRATALAPVSAAS